MMEATPQQTLQAILTKLAGKNAKALARVQSDAFRLISSHRLGRVYDSRMGRFEKDGEPKRGIANKRAATRQIEAVERHAKALTAALDGLAWNVRAAFRSDLAEIRECVAPLEDDARRAAAEAVPKGKRGVRHYEASEVDSVAAKIYLDYTGKPATRIWDPYKEQRRGYVPFLSDVFKALGMPDSARGTVEQRSKRQKAPA